MKSYTIQIHARCERIDALPITEIDKKEILQSAPIIQENFLAWANMKDFQFEIEGRYISKESPLSMVIRDATSHIIYEDCSCMLRDRTEDILAQWTFVGLPVGPYIIRHSPSVFCSFVGHLSLEEAINPKRLYMIADNRIGRAFTDKPKYALTNLFYRQSDFCNLETDHIQMEECGCEEIGETAYMVAECVDRSHNQWHILSP